MTQKGETKEEYSKNKEFQWNLFFIMQILKILQVKKLEQHSNRYVSSKKNYRNRALCLYFLKIIQTLLQRESAFLFCHYSVHFRHRDSKCVRFILSDLE